jgi:signal transduction histidine kinase
MGILLVLALTWIFSLPMNVRYTDLIAERAYFQDTHAEQTIQTIQQQSFTPYEGPLFAGNNSRPLWLRLTLAPAPRESDWVIMLQPNTLHYAEVWWQGNQGEWQRAEMGSRLAYNQRDAKALAPLARIAPSEQARSTVYVRVQTPSTPVHAQVISRQNSIEFDALESLMSGGFIGIGLVLTFFSALLYVNTRDGLWGFDALCNVAGMLVLSLQMGLASRLVFPDSENLVNEIMLYANVSYVFIVTILHRLVFGLFAIPRWAYLFNTIILLAFPVLCGLIITGMGDKAMALNNVLIMASSFWGVLVAIKAQHPDRFALWVFRGSYIGLVAYFVCWSIPMVLQQQTGNLATLYPNLPTSLFSMFLLMLILLRNTQLKAQETQRLALQKRDAERDLQESQRRHEETQGFLGMVLHEVKNPLSSIRMIVANLENTLPDADAQVSQRLQRVHGLVDDIDDVLERGVEIDSLEQGALVAEKALVNVAAWVQEFAAAHAAVARLHITAPDALLAQVDTHLLSMMLRNLVDNAVKYAPEGSPILVQLNANAQGWQLSVRSRVGAVGFPDADQIFNKYYRSPLAMRRSGLGLGLYWVRGAARQLGGDATYARDQEWVVFTLWLPN